MDLRTVRRWLARTASIDHFNQACEAVPDLIGACGPLERRDLLLLLVGIAGGRIHSDAYRQETAADVLAGLSGRTSTPLPMEHQGTIARELVPLLVDTWLTSEDLPLERWEFLIVPAISAMEAERNGLSYITWFPPLTQRLRELAASSTRDETLAMELLSLIHSLGQLAAYCEPSVPGALENPAVVRAMNRAIVDCRKEIEPLAPNQYAEVAACLSSLLGRAP